MLALAPLALVAGELLATLRGDRRLLAMTRVVCVYYLRGLAALATCGLLWLASGAGRLIGTRLMQDLHWRLLRWFVSGVAGEIRTAMGIEIAPDGCATAFEALRREEPLLMFSRHAGPGDTILLIDMLLSAFDRRPSVVFKEAVALEPTINLIARRLPQAMLDTDEPEQCASIVAEVSRRLGPRSVLLLYPEGGNFTRERRTRALRSLRRHGQKRALAQARRMTHVLPPRPRGAQAALAGNPAAPVVFAAHTGLGLAAYPLEIWRALPLGGTFRTRMWVVPRDEVPVDPEAQREWLNGWWKRLDDWIDGRGEENPGP